MKKAAAARSKREPFPYETRLDERFKPLELVDLKAVVDGVRHPWFNQTLCRVNDSVVRLGVVKGEYHWHQHDDLDEFFYVVEGRLLIDVDERAKDAKRAGKSARTIELAPRQGFVVPKAVLHRTRAPERAIILMVEGAEIVPTGD
jgi:mannose-6-phosphate isomerase-like protein (cupin superfamily)